MLSAIAICNDEIQNLIDLTFDQTQHCISNDTNVSIVCLSFLSYVDKAAPS